MTFGAGLALNAATQNHSMNTYETTHRAACPNGKLIDTYEIKITSHNTIIVEDLIAILKSAPDPIFQEDLADHLRAKIGAKVEIVGWHFGFKVTCVRD
jgi:hypothetical protein